MITVRQGLRSNTDPDALLAIEERSRYLFVVRLIIGAGAGTIFLADPGGAAISTTAAIACSTAYLAIAAIPDLLERREALLVPLARGMLLLDGIFLASAVAVTGGATSPARFLAFGHVVAVILLFSYRSGLKIALWHTLLLLLVASAEPAGLFGPARPYGSIEQATIITVLGLWVTALGTATFAALSERELRRQKIDLEHLSAMLGRIQVAQGPTEIAWILLDELNRTFGFRRGAVLASPDGGLSAIASWGEGVHATGQIRPDPVVSRALSDRSVVALHAFDPAEDPGLATVFPAARNVLVVPLLVDRGRALGIVVLERAGAQRAIRRWIVAMVEQFASHGALALHAAWLSEDREATIRRIEELQTQLEAYNADLEATVAERTGELRTAIAHLEEVDRQRRRLLEHVVKVGEEERHRIAGDIHDDPVQKLVALKMRLELLGKAHPGLEGIDEAKETVLIAIRSLRHLLFDLRPPVLDEQGLAPALRSFLENAEVDFLWSVEDELVSQPSDQTRLILYRIAQEALTNARKHSRAEHLRVRLSGSEDGITMEIADDGVGFEPQHGIVAAPGHLGLAAIRERAEMAGGRCELHSLPGQGTTLDVWMPSAAAVPDGSASDNGPGAPTFVFAGIDLEGEQTPWNDRPGSVGKANGSVLR